MSDKNNFSNKLERLVSGKGFYIVLFSCIAVIGVSAWVLAFYGNTASDTGYGEEDYAAVMADANDVLTVPETDYDVIAPTNEDTTTQLEVEPEEPIEVMNPITVPVEEPPVEETDEQEPEVQETVPEAPSENETESKTSGTSTDDLIFIWPVIGEIEVDYSPASLIYNKTMADWRTHSGVDIAAQIGTKVMAVADGTVESIGTDDMYGTVVRINHGDGLVSVYANLAAVPTVKEGDSVTMGSVIGSVGDTALGEAGEVAHLHFEMIKNDLSVDPADYLPNR